MSVGMNFAVAIIIALCTFCFLPCAAKADDATCKLSSAQLLTLVRESESVKSKHDLNLLGTGPSVTVLTTPYKGASKRDLQIESVFVARALIEGAPGQVDNVKVIFAGQPLKGEEGLVSNVDKKMIVAYSKGQVTPDKLLAAVRLIPVQPEATPNVVPGAQQERRLLIWQRIDKLSQQGTGTKPFKALFNAIEESVKNGELTSLSVKLEDLELKLSEQEEQVALARKAAQGRGVISPNRANTNRNASMTSPLAKNSNEGGLQSRKDQKARREPGGSSMVPGSRENIGASNFGLKRLYANRQVLLRTLQRKGDHNLSRVQELLSVAEENFKLGKESDAMAKLAEIKSIVDRNDNGSFARPFSLRTNVERPNFQRSNFERSRKDRFSI